MQSRFEASDPRHRSNIIDAEASEPAGPDPSDRADTNPRLRPQTFRDRHALKIMGVVMAALFTAVIVAQVGC